MRSTLHAVSLDDYRHFLPALRPMFQALRTSPRQRAAGRGDASRSWPMPRSRSHLCRARTSSCAITRPTLDPEIARDVAWWLIRRYAAFVNVPSETTWSFSRRPTYIDAAVWLDGAPFADDAAAVAHLVRRYLAAFGPATPRDAAAWSGLPIARLRPGFEALDSAGELARFADADGRELLDLVGGAAPGRRRPGPAAAPADVGQLAPRLRRPDPRHQRRAPEASSSPGTATRCRRSSSTAASRACGGRKRTAAPTARRARAVRAARERGPPRALEREGEALAAFVAPHEPDVYRRYRYTRARER